MVAPWEFLIELSLKQQQEDRRQLFWAGMALSGALLLLAMIISGVKHWRRSRPTRRLSSSDQLAHFRTLYEEGQLSEEEFAQVRALLLGQVKKEADEPPEPHPGPKLPAATAPGSADQIPPSSGNGEPRPEKPPAAEGPTS